MKKFYIIILLALAACGPQSSPEGRSKIRDEKLQEEVADLKNQMNAIHDSVRIIRKELDELNLMLDESTN
ncbi:hypothetical protein [Sphingobacterium sp. SYP-B4668]|uniref:hypothetical protein n=1 Tax=Sphingobacterium sp. SYP-B4668 TaxID=2996035 RepID=UPI0022DD3B80|nr:hypothetical protein [Sphingobacterium sp. SYP-B4668]